MQSNTSAHDATIIYGMPYRAALDHITTTRVLVARVALNASLLSSEDADQDAEKLQATLTQQGANLRNVLEVLQGKTVFPDLPDELSLWLSKSCEQESAHIQVIARMADMTDALCVSAQSPDGVSSKALHSYVKMGESDFSDTVTALTNALWDKIETGRDDHLNVVMQSTTKLSERVHRLERIGRYVRSMSINASVEASRAGEAGKGLAIIAQEFKLLAEEVQQLTRSAGEDIESIVGP